MVQVQEVTLLRKVALADSWSWEGHSGLEVLSRCLCPGFFVIDGIGDKESSCLARSNSILQHCEENNTADKSHSHQKNS